MAELLAAAERAAEEARQDLKPRSKRKVSEALAALEEARHDLEVERAERDDVEETLRRVARMG
jgi:hypothetical protein